MFSEISDSSPTSPTISMSGWSAKVARMTSRMSRGRFATRTRIAFSIAYSPKGLESVHHWTVSKCPFFTWLGEGSKNDYWKTPLFLGSYTKQNLMDTKVDLFQYTYPGTVGQRLQCQSNPASLRCTRAIQNLDT